MKIKNRFVILGLIGSLFFVNVSIVQADTLKTTMNKLAGTDRYKTAIDVSKAGWSTAQNAILVNGTALPDALCVGPLADEYNAPILLTEKDKLNADTLTELKRLGVKEVTIIGGNSVISQAQENDLKSKGFNIDRIYGSTRYETSIKIADKLKPMYQAKGQRKTVFLANGVKGLADATSVGGPAGAKDGYILYTDGQNLDNNIKKFIETSADDVYLIGGTSVISQGIEKELRNTTNKSIHRISGTDRKDTNAKVIDMFFANKNIENIYVAKDGMDKENELVDALAVGALASQKNAPILISSGNLGSTQRNLVIDKEINNVVQVGEGSNSVTVKEIIDLKTKGISFNDFENKLPSMGFEAGGAYFENGKRLGIINADNNGAYFLLERNSDTFNNTIRNCFNLLLPSQGDRLYNIVSNPFNDQTLEMDGRKVVIEQFPQGVSVEIFNK